MVLTPYKDGFLKASLNFVIHSVIDELYDWRFKPLLSRSVTRNRFQGRCRVGKVAQPRLQTEDRFATFDHSGYRNSDTAVKCRLSLRTHKFSRRLDGIHRVLFVDHRDQVIKGDENLMLRLGIDDVPKNGLGDVLEKASFDCIRLLHGAGNFILWLRLLRFLF